MKRFALVLALVLLACGGDSGTNVDNSIAGTWTLRSINGTDLPYVVQQQGANKLEVTADVLTVVDGGAFTEITTVRTTINGTATTQTIPDSGAYTVNGSAVTFQLASDGSINTGTWAGDTFTLAVDGFSYIYKR